MFFFNDTVQYVFTDDGNGNGHLIPSQFAKLTSYWGQSPENQKTRLLIRECWRLRPFMRIDERRSPSTTRRGTSWRSFIRYRFTIRGAEANSVWDSIKGDGPAGRRFALISFILPSLSRANQKVREATMNELATRTLTGILQYRLDRGALPERLGELTPAYVAAIPVDEYSGMHLRYTPDGRDFKLYSVGENLQDDGGSSEKIKDGSGKGRAGPADIVYWPPPD